MKVKKEFWVSIEDFNSIIGDNEDWFSVGQQPETERDISITIEYESPEKKIELTESEFVDAFKNIHMDPDGYLNVLKHFFGGKRE